MPAKARVSGVLIGILCLVAVSLAACSPPPARAWSGLLSCRIVIAAPPEKVFAYITDWKNQTQWDSGLKGISDLEGSGGENVIVISLRS